MFQLCHYRCVLYNKYCILLCQSLQLVALHLHSLGDCVDVVNLLVMLLCRVIQYTVDVLYRRGAPPLPCGCCCFPLLVVVSVKEYLLSFVYMAFMFTVICSNCAITAVFYILSTAFYCASPSSSWLCIYIPWVIVLMWSISL